MSKEKANPHIESLERRVIELSNQLSQTHEELSSALDLVREMKAREIGKPMNFDTPSFDDILNNQIDNTTILKGIVSHVYWGRVVSIQQMGDGTIELRQQSHHQLQKLGDIYKPMRHTLSTETFILILEAMQFAEKKFGLDRKAVIEKLTGGDDIMFKEAIIVM